MATLAMTLLGPLLVTHTGHTLTAFRSARALALLAYLAVNAGRPQRREVLAGLLWPERPDRVALHHLRYTLSYLRTAIGDRVASPPFLLVSRESIQLNPAGDCWLDVQDFLSSTGHLCARHELAAAAWSGTETLESAVALYRGPFLEGFSLRGSPAFEEWILYQRERFHRQALGALQRLAVLYEVRAELDWAEACMQRYVELEPWEEAAHRHLMRLLAWGGRRSAALAQYEACRRLLARDLGVDPAPQTRALFDCIRAGERPAAETGQTTGAIPAPSLPVAPPSAGRERGQAALDGFLDRALAGQGQAAPDIAQLYADLAALRASGTFASLPVLLSLLAEAYLCTGQAQKGLPLVDEALALAEQSEARPCLAEMHRLRADLRRAAGDTQ